MVKEILAYFPLFVAVIALLSGMFIFLKGIQQSRPQIYLGIILLGLSIRLINQATYQLHIDFEGRSYMMVLGFMQFGILPSVYLHLSSLISDEEIPTRHVFLHFLPMILVFISLITPAFYKDYTFLTEYNYSNSSWLVPSIISIRYLHLMFFLIGFFYLFRSYKLLLIAFSDGTLLGTYGKIIGQWSLFILFPLSMLFMIFLENFLAFLLGFQVNMNLESTLLLRALFVSGILIFIFKHDNLQFGIPRLLGEADFTQINKGSEQQNSSVPIWIKSNDHENTRVGQRVFQNQENIDRMIECIDAFVSENRPFRDPNFGIDELSRAVRIPAQHLRYIFKYHSHMGFVNFRNYCRMEDLINRMMQDDAKNYTLEGIALEHGFGSHSVVLRTFKLHYNATPSEVLQNKQNNLA